MAEWASDSASSSKRPISTKSARIPVDSDAQRQQMDSNAQRTSAICASLKSMYAKSVFPLEKKYQYDYFFESPFLSDVEFDGKFQTLCQLEISPKNWCRCTVYSSF